MRSLFLREESLNHENRPVEVELPVELIVHQTKKKHRLRVTIAWATCSRWLLPSSSFFRWIVLRLASRGRIHCLGVLIDSNYGSIPEPAIVRNRARDRYEALGAVVAFSRLVGAAPGTCC